MSPNRPLEVCVEAQVFYFVNPLPQNWTVNSNLDGWQRLAIDFKKCLLLKQIDNQMWVFYSDSLYLIHLNTQNTKVILNTKNKQLNYRLNQISNQYNQIRFSSKVNSAAKECL